MDRRRPRLVRVFQRAAKGSLVGLGIAFAVLMLAIHLDEPTIGIPAIFVITFCGIAYIVCLIVRDTILMGSWHFSLRSLLLCMTVVAIYLGLVVIAINTLRGRP